MVAIVCHCLRSRKRRREIEREEDIEKVHWACSNGPRNLKESYRIVEKMIEDGVTVNDLLDSKDITPLETACHAGCVDIANLLIVNGADPNMATDGFAGWDDSIGCSLLVKTAASSGRRRLDVIKLLIDNGADVGCDGDSGDSMIHWAVHFKFKRAIMETILEAGGDIDAYSDTGETPLHVAVTRENVKLVKFLLRNNARIDVLDSDGLTAMERAEDELDEYDEHTEDMDDEALHRYDSAVGWQYESYKEIWGLIYDEQKRREDLRVKNRQQQCLSVVMAHHPRLGEESMINRLDPDVTRMILKFV